MKLLLETNRVLRFEFWSEVDNVDKLAEFKSLLQMSKRCKVVFPTSPDARASSPSLPNSMPDNRELKILNTI
jgi:hypothetical protein